MKKFYTTFALFSAITASVFAAEADYKIEAISPTIQSGDASDMAVSITNSSGQPITNARIIGVKLDMAMQGMDDMAMPVKQVASPSPAEYHFVGNVMHPGTWKLSVTARIPGESDPVSETIQFIAK